MRASEFADLLGGATKRGEEYSAKCPAHDDRVASLCFRDGEDRILLNCHAGCKFNEITTAAGIKESDLFHSSSKNNPQKRSVSSSFNNRATVQPREGCSLEVYAKGKRLPVDFLQKLGLRDQKYSGGPAVRIPYLSTDGTESAVRYRISLDGDERFRWKTGSKTTLYGLSRLSQAQKMGYVILVEGESDTHTLWFYDIPTLGIPGATTWKKNWAKHLDDIPLIYVFRESDKANDTLIRDLGTSFGERLRIIDLDGIKDPSDLHLSDSEKFKERWETARDAAITWQSLAEAEANKRVHEAWERCSDLARESFILEEFSRMLATMGVAGEERNGKLLYLILTTRFLERPVSASLKGPSSAGKSFILEKVLEFFPERAYHALSAMSEHALIYSEEPMTHRFLILFEAAGLKSDFASYLIRSLLSEGRIRYETVEKIDEEMRGRLIEREGPTGLLVTTTRIRLHPENETRLFSIPVTDTPEQTRKIFKLIAQDIGGDKPDLAIWHALQEWIEGAEHRVHIPFASSLAEKVPTVGVRLRRDFSALLSLIKAHAILHQAMREKSANGAIIATLDDYSAVRELVADLVAEGVEMSVPQSVRETVEAVKKILTAGNVEAKNAQVARELKLDKSAALRRVWAAIDRGFLENQEFRKGRPARLTLAESLPEEQVVLPPVGDLANQGCTVARPTEGDEHSSPVLIEVGL